MTLIEDTRQQSGKHDKKHKYWLSKKVYWRRTALDCGDYTLSGDSSICIDTKKDIDELIGDIQVKKMAKSKIEQNVDDICLKNGISLDLAKNIFHIICDDDEKRFVESELTFFCAENDISEEVLAQFQDLYVKRHGFFHRGLKRAQNSNIKLYILVDNKDGIKELDDLTSWVNPRMIRYNKIVEMHKQGKWKSVALPKGKPMPGEQLYKACVTMEQKYGCKFLFCKPEESGQIILDLLGAEVT